MKKIFLTMLGALLMAAPAAAQVSGMRVDLNKVRSAVEKAKADTQNPRNATRASAWLKLGEALIEADAAPVNGLYAGMPENMLVIALGTAPTSQETIEETVYTVHNYPNVKVYMIDGVVDFFLPTTVVQEGALDQAYEALDKAYQLDPKTAKKVGEDMKTIGDKSNENGTALYTAGDRKVAAAEFRRAFMVSNHPTSAAIDTMAIYYAGMSSANGEDYENAIRDLDKALEMGFENNGQTYNLKFYALYNLDRRPEALQVLQTGIAKYPGNEQLIDMIMRYYAENEGDPSSIIPLVQSAIAQNPQNPVLQQGLARIYNKLGQFEESIATIKKAIELEPDNFLSNYLEGLFLVTQGDQMGSDLSRQTITSAVNFQAAQAAINDVFRSAIAPLEKAYSINSSEISTVELLKNITFRLREEDGMMAKYERYNELFKTMVEQ